jgi:APA family basic amino acid/polyamine antiporter
VLRDLLRTKGLDEILAAAEGPHSSLRRSLGPVHVTLLGIGAIVGAGIFATVGTAAAGDAARPGAGPSLMLSFVLTAAVCALTALCYAEFAAMVPVSGSAYTYAYATLGELVAWIIGWDLIIEYAIGNVAVAISWANYFRSLLEYLGVHVPPWLATDYRTAARTGLLETAPRLLGVPIVCNALAFFIVMALTFLLIWGIKESARFNALMVGVKIVVLLFFVGVCLYFVPPAEMAANWEPFRPNGWGGTLAGAAVVFFAYIGFDAVSTVAEETRNPSRDLPVGIIASLVVCTVLYMVVAAIFTGVMPYDILKSKLATEQAEPLTMALDHVAPAARWAGTFVAFGSVVAHTAVLLVFQLGQPRIFFAMARDGLLPPVFARVHPRYRTPHVTTMATGLFVGLLASFASIDEMVDLTNIGTLFAFILVCIGIPILRARDPSRPRAFRVPFSPAFPLLGAASCLFLAYYLPPSSWWRFVGWLVLGMAVYCAYGYAGSRVGRAVGRPGRTPPALFAAAAGFVLLAVGLFLIPHDAGLVRLVREGVATDGPGRTRAGLALIATGAVVAGAGLARQSRRR